jgi:SET domain-containing protein
MATYSVFIDTDDLYRHELAFFTTRAVDANEELTLDYGGFNAEDKVDKTIHQKCHCGTPSCRGYLPLEDASKRRQY